MLPPRLETPRLILDAHTKADLTDLTATWADPKIVRHLGGRPFSNQESWFRLLRYRGLWPLLGFGYWCVRTKEDGRYVGDVGFADFMRETQPTLGDTPEAGWVLASWAHGRGFATEAVGAALAWFDTETDHQRVVCIMDANNQASARVAAKCGFCHAGIVTMMGDKVPLMARERSL